MPTAPASIIAVSAIINGSQQIPLNSSTATGTFSGSVNTSTRVLTYTVTYTGLNPTAGHIHRGRLGATGSVMVGFSSVTSPITGTATLTQPDLDSLLAGAAYVNLHTVAFPAGEIRGNILPSATSTIAFNATLNNIQQVPTNSSTATGTFSGAFDPVTRLLTYTVTYTGLTPTAAHIHRGAPGVTGSVMLPLMAVTPSSYAGTATLTQPDIDLLLAGAAYVNLHTATFPNGEIRGNILPPATSIIIVSAILNSSQQVPTNNSTATGTFSGAVDPVTRLLTYTVMHGGLAPTAGHIHRGGPGANGTVMVAFPSVVSSSFTGTAILTQVDLNLLLTGAAYVNLHSAAFPAGEIRGNLTTLITGIADEVVPSTTALWPNPAHAMLQLTGAAHAAVAVFDALGRTVYLTNLDAAGAATLDVRHLPAGIYTVRNGNVTRRLVVTKE